MQFDTYTNNSKIRKGREGVFVAKDPPYGTCAGVFCGTVLRHDLSFITGVVDETEYDCPGLQKNKNRFNYYAWRLNTKHCAWLVPDYYCSAALFDDPRTFRCNESYDAGTRKGNIEAAIEEAEFTALTSSDILWYDVVARNGIDLGEELFVKYKPNFVVEWSWAKQYYMSII